MIYHLTYGLDVIHVLPRSGTGREPTVAGHIVSTLRCRATPFVKTARCAASRSERKSFAAPEVPTLAEAGAGPETEFFLGSPRRRCAA